jgi:hypothetical protein
MGTILINHLLRGLGLLRAQSASESVMGKRKSSFEKIYSYYLVPNQKEILHKQATIEYNGQVYKTDPVKITVTAALNNRETLTILVFQ